MLFVHAAIPYYRMLRTIPLLTSLVSRRPGSRSRATLIVWTQQQQHMLHHRQLSLVIHGGSPCDPLRRRFVWTGSSKSPLTVSLSAQFYSAVRRTIPFSVVDLHNSPLAGLGFGLPMTRAHAQFLKGDLNRKSCEGFDADCYKTLSPRLKVTERTSPISNGFGFRSQTKHSHLNCQRNSFRSFSTQATEQDPLTPQNNSLTIPPAIKSAYDTSSHWVDWFPNAEYRVPSDYNITSTIMVATGDNDRKEQSPLLLEPLSDDPGLDAASRHLIRQLQILYHDGFNNDEVITLQRCHHAIGRLLANANNEIADSDARKFRERIMRAVAVFHTMELFWDFVPDVLLKKESSVVQGNRNKHRPAKLPVPTFELYVIILRALASFRVSSEGCNAVQNQDLPWLSQDIMLRLLDLHQRKGMVYLKRPSVEAWNDVLCTWANAHGSRDHPEKALHAVQFLLDMKTNYKVIPDASSYSHTLRACAHHDQNSKAKELGSKLAVRVWNGVIKNELKAKSYNPTSRMYVFLMRALSGLANPREKEFYLREAWESASAKGVANEFVLHELEISSAPLFKELSSQPSGK